MALTYATIKLSDWIYLVFKDILKHFRKGFFLVGLSKHESSCPSVCLSVNIMGIEHSLLL